jgi:predicted dehydrogenase
MRARVNRNGMREPRRPRIGFLGAGWIGRMRLQALLGSREADVCVIADPSELARSLAAQIVPDAFLVKSLEELFQFDLDGIVVASPSALHADDTVTALNRGLAVFCEKPLGCTFAETRAALAAAEAANRLLAVDFAYRFTAGVTRIRELISENLLGSIFALDLTFHNSYGPDKAWFYDPALSGGGCLIDLGIHLVDAALWMLNFPSVCVDQADIFARGRRLCRPTRGVIEDYAIATLALDTNIIARLACSWLLPMGQDAFIRMAVYGSDGSAEFRNIDGSFYDFRADLFRGRARRELCGPPDDWGGRAIIDWVRRLSIDNAFDPAALGVLRVSEVVDAIYGRESAA